MKSNAQFVGRFINTLGLTRVTHIVTNVMQLQY